MMARWKTTRRSATWARWVGWTLMFALGLGIWDLSLVFLLSLSEPPWAHGVNVVVAGVFTLGLALLAFRFGVRFPVEWVGVAGTLVANGLVCITPLLAFEWPQQSGVVIVGAAMINLLFTLPAAAGVWWAKRREVADV